MKWTLSLGRVAGIPVQVHATFLLLLAWVSLAYWRLEPSLASVRNGVLFLLLVFAIVLLHELSHSLVARAFGVGTRDITLYPIGGVSRLERTPDRPHEELLVALAGPALNFVLAGACAAMLLARDQPLLDPSAVEGALGSPVGFMRGLLWVNVALGAFNLVPAFPMDGGRALRALLALFLDRGRATGIAAGLGKVLAAAFFLVGLVWSPVLAIIGIFVWLGASAEGASADLQRALAGLSVRDAMISRVQTVTPGDALARPVQDLLSGFQQDFPVVDQGRLVGMLPLEALLRGLVERGHDAPVAEAMVRELQTVRPQDDLVEVVGRLSRRERRCVPVVEGEGTFVGVVTLDTVAELLRIHAALDGWPGERGEWDPFGGRRRPAAAAR